MTTHRIEAGRLVPGRGAPIDDAVLVLDGPTIRFAGPAADAPPTPGAEIHHVAAVLPGLWDCHVHLLGEPGLDLPAVARRPVERLTARAAVDATQALRAGFTSLREVGGLGIHLRAAIADGYLRGPTIHSSHAIISTTGGHGDLHEDPLGLVDGFGRAGGMLRLADGVPEVLRATREQLRMGAAVIKVCASGGVLSELDDPVHQQFSAAELRTIVEEGARAERVVAAHCHGAPGIEAAIDAGVHTIEHGSYLTADHAAAMIERGMVLVPTRTVVDGLLAMGDDPSIPERSRRKAHQIADRHADALALAIESGVTIACGTDIGASTPDHPLGWGRNARELELLVAAGMTPLQAIEAATATAPQTLGPQAPSSGQLREGYDADVLAVAADPSDDVSVLTDPAHVVGVWRSGEHVVRSIDGVPTLTPIPLAP